jgi:dTDP-glucose 4,6-dehydratase
MRILVTGGAGFIGGNFVRHVLLEHADWEVVNLDLLTYAGNLKSLEDLLDEPRHSFVRLDIADADALRAGLTGHFDLVLNFAAESHVDRSIADASEFVRTNVLGAQTLLDLTRERGWGRFLQVSTDEVYGSLGPEGLFSEHSPIKPTSPYAASKACADLLVMAAGKTHGQDVVLTRCSNNYGPYQFPEKLIPLMILNALEDKPLPVYGDGKNIRDWIHVEDHCRAVLTVAERGAAGQVYNIGGKSERTNIDVVKTILTTLDKPESLIQFVTDRPAHDLRYAIDPAFLEAELGFTPRHDFETDLKSTIAWYQEHREWCDEVRSGEYRRFTEAWYGERLGG